MSKTIIIIVLGALLAGGVYFYTSNLKKEKTAATHTELEGVQSPTDPFEEQTGGVDIGDIAPDFSGPTPDGETISLSDVLAENGKVTIVEFWASWCPYCRAEMPNVSNIYKKYHDKGLEIISVSIDQNKSEWVNGIEEFDMDWAHISNLMEWDDPVAALYGVTSIPTNFLLNEDGEVIAKGLKGEQLESLVSRILK